MMFLFVIMGATHGKAPAGFAPIAIGLCLTLIHLVSIPVTNTSVNPARSTGPALFVGGWAIGQLWLFWIAPTLGGAAGGVLYRWLSDEPSAQVTGSLPESPRALTQLCSISGAHRGKSGSPAGCDRRARHGANRDALVQQ